MQPNTDLWQLYARATRTTLRRPPRRGTTREHHGLREQRRHESYDLDFKAALYGPTDSDKRDLGGDVPAMANTAGGVILLGEIRTRYWHTLEQADRGLGRRAGVPLTEEALRRREPVGESERALADRPE